MSNPSFCRAGVAVFAVLVVGLSCAAPVSGAENGEAEPAVWSPKELTFTYMGFTAKYSCEGLASKVKTVLRALGARQDLTVYGTGCAVSYGHPAPMPGVRIRMNVLEPVSKEKPAGDSAVVPAHWKVVEVKLDPDPVSESGECELVEQIKQKVLPLFAARDVQFKPDCVPHQLSANGARLMGQLLIADKPDAEPGDAGGRAGERKTQL